MLSHAPSHNTAHLAATAVISGLVVAGTLLGYQHIRREQKVENLKHSIPELDEKHKAERLGNFGFATPPLQLSKEDERSAALAARALQGDYDDGLFVLLFQPRSARGG